LLRAGLFDQVYLQPAAGDAGGALGAALGAYHLMLEQPRVALAGQYDGMKGSYLGPDFSDEQAIFELDAAGAAYVRLDSIELIDRVAQLLADGKAFGWVQGRMEFGPRALGARSIIADPRSPEMQKALNLKVKFRESFRPFAPSVLLEDVKDWFDIDADSPYMLLVADVADRHRLTVTEDQAKLFGIEKLNVPKSVIPAVTHVDYSARIQTVTESTNPMYYRLLKAFKKLTGCPVLVNTSFNVRGEPIVCSPTDAYRCFMGCDLDYLVIGNFLLDKTAQDPAKVLDYKNAYELD
jgi:carbamoyltransferase